jgi:hypothetical protein
MQPDRLLVRRAAMPIIIISPSGKRLEWRARYWWMAAMNVAELYDLRFEWDQT